MAVVPVLQTQPQGDDDLWLSDEELDLWQTLVSVQARLLGRLDAELQAAHAISLHDYEVLVHLSEAPDLALRMAELAKKLVVSPSGLTRRLDGLVREGLVERRACLSDRRGTLAVLSPAGLDLLEEAAPTHVAGVRRYLFDTLSAAQLRNVRSALRTIGRSLEPAPR